ncbi:MAG: ABC transporter ATP-binding protein [Actinobacteria bacterium]|nr:ABC transporter ATP-binding protein [Actinomycetota bacterium]
MQSAVTTTALRREFKPRKRGLDPITALDDVSLAVEPGEIHGLLGPNGAGKTTLVKILSTILTPTSGTATVLGHDVVEDPGAVRRVIGLVFGGDRGLYTLLSARHNLEYWAALYGVPSRDTGSRIDALLARVGLTRRADDRVETYSRGMRQRLHLARGLVSDPEVLFLDEPTVGLDPVASLEFRELVMALREEGKTIFLTTHDMGEAEAICDRVSLIDRGALLATEGPETLGRWITAYERVEARGVTDDAATMVSGLPGVMSTQRLPDGTLRIETAVTGVVRPIMEALLAAGVTELGTRPPSLEEVYLRVFGDRGLQV